MNYLDLFSGIGGFRLGLERAGFKFAWTGHAEIDKHASSIYRYHYPESEELGDVRNIRKRDLPEVDILTFGFPCQDLSVSGRRKGLHASRSGLFFEALRIIRATLPKVFIFENVQGLLHSNRGRDFETVIRQVAHVGLYDCEGQLLNTRWVRPQNRERFYFIGHLRGSSSPKVFPFGGANRKNKALEVAPKPVVSCLTTSGSLSAQCQLIELRKRKGKRRLRLLTPREWEAAHGFPDNWTQYGRERDDSIYEVSGTQRYKCLGNAVSPPLVQAMGERLKR